MGARRDMGCALQRPYFFKGWIKKIVAASRDLCGYPTGCRGDKRGSNGDVRSQLCIGSYGTARRPYGNRSVAIGAIEDDDGDPLGRIGDPLGASVMPWV
jgi:hypothetical protein